MRKVTNLTLVFALLAVTPLFAQSGSLGNDNNNNDPRGTNSNVLDVKPADTVNYHISNRADSVDGDIDGSVLFDRRFSVTYDGTCDASSTDSSNDDVGYQVFQMYSPSGEDADVTVTLDTLEDSTLFLYCGFDPANPDLNLVAWDDDDGPGLGSAFLPGDGFALAASTTYDLVVASYGTGDNGAFTVDLGGDLVFGLGCEEPAIVEPLPPVGDTGITVTGTPGCTYTLYLTQNGVLNTYDVTVGDNGSVTDNTIVVTPDTSVCVAQQGAPDPGCTGVTTVPTLGEWGLLAFVLMLVTSAVFFMRRPQIV
jgi:hypothetical protein